MKKKYIKIVCILCMIWAFSLNANAQWHFGIEGGSGVHPAYLYDPEGFFMGKDNTGRWVHQANIMGDYLLPRQWTPNWLTLSLRTGAGFMWAEDCSSFNTETGNTFTRAYGIDIPFEIEFKYLFSNRIRFYLNGGGTFFYAVHSGREDSFNFFSGDPLIKSTHLGYQFGAGFEFGFFRIGYKNLSLAKTLTDGDYGNRLKSAHCLSIGFWFNGNRFLKKHSSLKAF
ncbi:outer membrane beta-barrel protein [Phocaeicola sp.]|uniref:outer membrane beta-barrel protein n=1 Tax=Phocaeicola sp. TaxID=2773926 RepID=UPI002842ABEB|nr:outer membrane beta-barrel protein [Phocaeicola sp.]MDR3793849.1 outer membrane beta-barrel protein [Phocaeicola sp.]